MKIGALVHSLRSRVGRRHALTFVERPQRVPDKPTTRVRTARVGRARRAIVPEMGHDLCPRCGRPDETPDKHICGVGHRW